MRGDSGFIHTNHQVPVEDERHNFPEHSIHVTNIDAWGNEGEWAVWLNTEVADFDGLTIGLKDSREAAIRDAIETLETAIALLKKAEAHRAD